MSIFGDSPIFKFFSEPHVAAHSTSARFQGLRISEKVNKMLYFGLSKRLKIVLLFSFCTIDRSRIIDLLLKWIEKAGSDAF